MLILFAQLIVLPKIPRDEDMIAFTASAMMSSLLGRHREIDDFILTQSNHYIIVLPVYINIR